MSKSLSATSKAFFITMKVEKVGIVWDNIPFIIALKENTLYKFYTTTSLSKTILLLSIACCYVTIIIDSSAKPWKHMKADSLLYT